MPIFLLLFATGLWAEWRPVTSTWRELIVFDMTIFDLESFEYTWLLMVLGFKEWGWSSAFAMPVRDHGAKHLGLHKNSTRRCLRRKQQLTWV